MKVLVTGGNGWIGRATCRELERQGYDYLTFDRHPGPKSALVDGELDIRNERQVYGAVLGADHVIHLAGVLGTHELLDSVHQAVDINVMGSINVIGACVKYDVPLTQITMPRVNPSVYAATKSCAMDLSEAMRHAEGLKVSYVRAYNAYGPGQAYGGDHPQKIIPTFASKAWAGEALPIWGNGMLWCDLVHVDDVARMLVAALGFGNGQVFDAGSGYPQTVLEVARKVIRIVEDEKGPHYGGIMHLPPRKGERTESTDKDVATGEGWNLLEGWRPIFDPERFKDAVLSYRPTDSPITTDPVTEEERGRSK